MPRSKLTDAQIAEIRRLYSLRGSTQNWTVAKLAGVFGTSKAKIVSLCRDLPFAGYRGYPQAPQNLESSSPFARD